MFSCHLWCARRSLLGTYIGAIPRTLSVAALSVQPLVSPINNVPLVLLEGYFLALGDFINIALNLLLIIYGFRLLSTYL